MKRSVHFSDIQRRSKLKQAMSLSMRALPHSIFYVIAKGVLDVVLTDKGETPKVLARLSDLSCFGEMGLVNDAPHSASVIAVENSRLRRFSIEKFHQLMELEDRVVYRMILGLARLISHRLQSSDDRRVR